MQRGREKGRGGREGGARAKPGNQLAMHKEDNKRQPFKTQAES